MSEANPPLRGWQVVERCEKAANHRKDDGKQNLPPILLLLGGIPVNSDGYRARICGTLS